MDYHPITDYGVIMLSMCTKASELEEQWWNGYSAEEGDWQVALLSGELI